MARVALVFGNLIFGQGRAQIGGCEYIVERIDDAGDVALTISGEGPLAGDAALGVWERLLDEAAATIPDNEFIFARVEPQPLVRSWKDMPGVQPRALLPGLLGAGVVAMIIAKEDLGTAVLIAVTAGVMLLGAGVGFWRMMSLTPVAGLLVAVGVLIEPYRIRRLTTFLDPFADPQNAGFHMIQSMAAISGGGVFGRGLGFGIQKFGYLPEDQNDFLFAVICEELGLAGAALTLALEFGLIVGVFCVLRRVVTPAAKLLCLGVMTTLGVQAAINLLAVTGLGPTKGIALPLLSAGGTGWVLTAGMLGLVAGREAFSDETAEAGTEPEAVTEPSPPPAIVTRPVRPARPEQLGLFP